MGEPYTPQENTVMAAYTHYRGIPVRAVPWEWGTSVGEFGRWLDGVRAAARREGQAEAWEAGAQAQSAAYGMDKDTGPNPYRNGADQ